MAKIRVLVYGTLKTNETNFHVMQRAQGVSLGRANTVVRDFLLVDLGYYPAAIPVQSDQGTIIRGELFELDESNLHVLDGLEGFPSYYDRIELDVCYGERFFNEEIDQWDCPTCKAWMYFIPGNKAAGGREYTVCEDGVWYPPIRRECRDFDDLINPEYRGAAGDAAGQFAPDDDTYYDVHDAPGGEVGVDGSDEIHDLVESAIALVYDDLVHLDDVEEDDEVYDYAEIILPDAVVTIEVLETNMTVLKEALEGALKPTKAEQSA